MKFQAVIDGVQFDPKKGEVKLVLIGASHVSLDELTTLSPKGETIQVTLESEQPRISDVGAPRGEKGAAWLEEAARKLGESEEHENSKEAGRVLQQFPLLGASEEGGD
jgi:beta-lactam-binding protein with PASTA domain